MELFHKAKEVRLQSHHEKYLLAEEDEESVSQDRNGSSRNARWTVEFVKDSTVLRLKSCYGKYLTASNIPFLLGWTGRKVLQTLPKRLDSSVEWEPIREGFHVKLKTRHGKFLRANGGIPPWKNHVTHDMPHRSATQDWVLWEVDIVEIQVGSPRLASPAQSGSSSDSPLFESKPGSPFAHMSPESSGSASAHMSPKLSKLESSVSYSSPTSTPKAEGRTIYFTVTDKNSNVGEALEASSFNFKGNSVFELTQKLEEKTGLSDIIVCSRNPLNGKLNPLRLHLPPSNTTMSVVVVQASSKAAKGFPGPENPA